MPPPPRHPRMRFGHPRALQQPPLAYPRPPFFPPWTMDWRLRPEAQEDPTPQFPSGLEVDLRQQVMELRRHIDQLEEERHLESERKKEEKKERAKTETEQYQMLALANENLDRDRKEQAAKREKLDEDGRKLAKEKEQVDAERRGLESEKKMMEENLMMCDEKKEAIIKGSLEYLTQEKEKTDLEMKLNEMERQHLEDKTKLWGRIRQLQKALTAATVARAKEESHQMSVRRQEKEIQEEMLKNLNSKERQIEDLESEVSKLESEVSRIKKQLEEESASTSKDSTMSLKTKTAAVECPLSDDAEPATSTISKVQCVLCSKNNSFPVSAFVFHIARDHMFDQYRIAGMPSEGEQVARFLTQLEEKARKEAEARVRQLEKSLLETGEQLARERAGEGKDVVAAENFLQGRIRKEVKELESKVKQQHIKIMSLEGEKLSLVARKESLEKQGCREDVMREELETTILKKDALQKEVEAIRKQQDGLVKEVGRKRKELKEETQRRRGWKDKYEAKKNEAEILRKKSLDLSCDLNRLSEALVRERQEKKEEVAAMMQRVKQLESAEDELLEMATKFALTEVEDEIYRDDKRNDEVSKERGVFSVVDEEACPGVPHFGVERVNKDQGVSTEKVECEMQAAKRRRLSISSVDSEVGNKSIESKPPAAVHQSGKELKNDNFDFSLLDSSQEETSADIHL